jgi:hypothetical protein
MPTPTYTLIASSTVGSGGSANIDFTSIPGTYTDLLVKCSARTNRTGSYEDAIKITFNGSGGSAYSVIRLYGDGASASSSSGTSAANILPYSVSSNTVTANTFGTFDLYVPNYLSSNYKSASIDMVSEANATNAIAGLAAGLWASTSAITQITLAPNVGTLFLQYTTAYLYGIKNS